MAKPYDLTTDNGLVIKIFELDQEPGCDHRRWTVSIHINDPSIPFRRTLVENTAGGHMLFLDLETA